MLQEKVRNCITKYELLQKSDSVVVGVSGGPDSITLLNILLTLKEEYNLKIYVAHINHMIRENAIKDEEYVKDFCNKNNIEVFIKKANIIEKSKQDKKGLEETGREVRYEFFEEVLKNTNSNKIAIAHNLNDKIETIIMNLTRGTGLSGLKGIEAKRGKYIRPLIEIERTEIEKYCDEENLHPRIDESNQDNTYTRNKIRNIIIPYIKKELNSNIINNLDRLSEIVKENEEYIEQVTQKEYKEILIDKSEEKLEFDTKAIKELVKSKQRIEKINIEDILKLLNNNIGNKYLTPTKKIKVGIKDKKIYFQKIEK